MLRSRSISVTTVALYQYLIMPDEWRRRSTLSGSGNSRLSNVLLEIPNNCNRSPAVNNESDFVNVNHSGNSSGTLNVFRTLATRMAIFFYIYQPDAHCPAVGKHNNFRCSHVTDLLGYIVAMIEFRIHNKVARNIIITNSVV